MNSISTTSVHLTEINEGKELVSKSSNESYVTVKILGRGSFGMVFEALRVSNNESVAIKVVEMNKQSETYESYKNELEIMSSLNNQNLVCLYDSWHDDYNGYLIMEYCNGGTLTNYLLLNKAIPESKALQMEIQILNGMKGLHQKNIAHRDLKPDNILIHNDQLKIADMGVSKKIEDAGKIMETVAGTPLFMAPEIMFCKPYTYQCDIYSLGCILYMMVYGEVPYTANSPYQLFKVIEAQEEPNLKKLDKGPNFEKNNIRISEDLQQLIVLMLQINPQKRISFDQLFQHKLFIVSPFQDRCLNDVQNIEITVNNSFLDRSKLALNNLKEGFKNKDTKSVLKEVKGLGAMFVNKMKVSFTKQEEKLKGIMDRYKKNKENEQAVIKTVNIYMEETNTYGILGRAAQEIGDKLKRCPDLHKNMSLVLVQFMLWKKLLFLYSSLKVNMHDPHYRLNSAISNEEMLFSDKLFQKLEKLVDFTLAQIDQEIHSSSEMVMKLQTKEERILKEVAQKENYNQISEMLFQQFTKNYYINIKKQTSNIDPSDVEGKERVQKHMLNIAHAINFNCNFGENGEQSFSEYRNQYNKLSFTERANVLESLEKQFK